MGSIQQADQGDDSMEGEIKRALGWVDDFFIPPESDNRATATAWINELLGANKVAAETYESVAGKVTCKDVPPALNKQTRDLFPYEGFEPLFAKAPIGLVSGSNRANL